MNKTNFLVAHPLKHHAFQLGAGCLESGYRVKCIFPLYYRFGLGFLNLLPPSKFNKLLGYIRPAIHTSNLQTSFSFKVKRLVTRSLVNYVDEFDRYVSAKIISGALSSDVFISLQDYMPLSVDAAKKQGMLIWSDQILNNSRSARSSILGIIKRYQPNHTDHFDFSKNERILHLADVITSPCEYCDSGFVGQIRKEAQLFRIPYGVDESTFTPKKFYRTQGTIRVLVRAQNIRKGGLQFLEAVSYFSKIWPQGEDALEFTMIGNLDTHVASALRIMDLPTWLSVKNTVVPNSDMPDLMRTSDFFMMPSMSESMSLMCIEAMKIGLPLMITNECGIDKFNNSMGYKIEPSAQSILEGLIYFMSKRDLWESWGKKASVVSQAYSWHNYRSVVAQTAKKVMSQI